MSSDSESQQHENRLREQEVPAARGRFGETDADLRESEERFRATFEQVAVGIVHVDPDGRFLRVNKKYCEIVGYSEEEVLARRFQDLTCADDLEADLDNVSRLLAGRISTYSIEKRYIRKDGSLIWVAVTRSLVRQPTGEPKYFIAVVQDITGRKNAEESQRRLQEQLNQVQKMEIVGQLAAGIAHDVNNMLMVISAHAALARMALTEEERVTRLDQLVDAIQDTGAIAKSLLTFSHRLHADKGPVDLRRTLREATRLIRRLLPAHIDVKVEESAPADFWVLADRTQLQQILLNLAINARDAMPDGGTLQFSLSAAPPAPQDDREPSAPDLIGEVRLTVTDTGAGIPPERLPVIFEPFFTTKPAGHGTGLGLAIVKAVVDEHGGQIDVTSRPGQGTTFAIRLPQIAPPPVLPVNVESRASPRGGGESVLLIEDNIQIRNVLTVSLRESGYTVLAAADANEALRLHAPELHRIGLLVLNLDLPEEAGSELLARLRRTAPSMPAILVTSTANPALEALVDARTRILRKPFRLTDLVAMAVQLLTAPDLTESPS